VISPAAEAVRTAARTATADGVHGDAFFERLARAAINAEHMRITNDMLRIPQPPLPDNCVAAVPSGWGRR
jgi:hypothetical protein